MTDTAESIAHGAERAPKSERRRRMALYVLCAGMLMIVLDATIVNVALPSIQEDLDFTQSNLAWVVNAYLIPFGGLLLLAGRLGDLVGQRRIFLIGLATFTVASLLCAVAQSQGVLIGARFVQGVGGALTSAVILGMIVTMFPERLEQAKAIGAYTFVAVAGGSIGLLAGGALTEAINWHWIFFVNLPVGLATGLLALRLVDGRDGIGLKAGADLPGAALLTAGLMLGVYTILEAGEQGWGSIQTLGLGGLSILLLAAFVTRQARIENPLMPLRLFRSRNVAGANLIQGLLIVGMFGTFFLGRAVPAADPRLRRARGRARLPAGDDRHGSDVVPRHRRGSTCASARGPRCFRASVHRRGPAALRAHARRRRATSRTSCRR